MDRTNVRFLQVALTGFICITGIVALFYSDRVNMILGLVIIGIVGTNLVVET